MPRRGGGASRVSQWAAVPPSSALCATAELAHIADRARSRQQAPLILTTDHRPLLWLNHTDTLRHCWLLSAIHVSFLVESHYFCVYSVFRFANNLPWLLRKISTLWNDITIFSDPFPLSHWLRPSSRFSIYYKSCWFSNPFQNVVKVLITAKIVFY